MYTHSPDPSKQYAILRKIRGSRDQAIPGYFAPQEQIPWVRGCSEPRFSLPTLVQAISRNFAQT
jgi:hypothetical protein